MQSASENTSGSLGQCLGMWSRQRRWYTAIVGGEKITKNPRTAFPLMSVQTLWRPFYLWENLAAGKGRHPVREVIAGNSNFLFHFFLKPLFPCFLRTSTL